MMSAYPSPFTSPTPATLKPSAASAWFDSSWAWAVLGSPSAIPQVLPRKTKAAPSSGSIASYSGAPTTMSAYPSPLTSPAPATRVPSLAAT
jgi:hypothetical protein